MAVRLEMTYKTKRTDVLSVDTRDIICDDSKNTRRFPHTEDEIKSLARNIFENAAGQIQAGRGFKNATTNKVELVLGFGRFHAVEYINNVMLPAKLGREPKDEERFAYKIELLPMMSEKERIIASIEENRDRKQPSVIDDAYNMRELLTKFNMSEDEVASLFGFADKNSVKQYLSLLTLNDDEQREIHDSALAFSSALRLTKMDSESRELTRLRAQELADEDAEQKLAKIAERYNVPAEDLKREATVVIENESEEETFQPVVVSSDESDSAATDVAVSEAPKAPATKKVKGVVKKAAEVLKEAKKPKDKHFAKAACEVGGQRASRSAKDIKDFFKYVINNDGRVSVQFVAMAIQAFCEGYISDEEAYNIAFGGKYSTPQEAVKALNRIMCKEEAVAA